MNATTVSPSSQKLFKHARPVLLRCLWKEYRMLRGFWLGVAGLAVLEMLAVAWLMSGSAKVELIFASAWGAAALYAVGAAVTLFAVELEEQTDVFLRLLPRHDGAVFAGKALAAAVTSFALAGVLIVIGGIVAGGQWPEGPMAVDVAAVGAVTVVEFLAWGVLASLMCPQPLLAAILAIAAASLATQLAIAGSSQTSGGFALADFRNAAPMRLALATAVSALDVWLGLRWLQPPTTRQSRRVQNAVVKMGEAAAVTATRAAAPSRRGLFWRLVWQSWREGWKAMLAALPIGLFLMFADALVTSMATRHPIGSGLPPILSLLVVPALYGALAFRADQRGRQYRFLADRAANPLLVWSARQAAWLTPLVALGIALQVVAWTLVGFFAERGFVASLVENWQPNLATDRYMTALHVEQGRRLVLYFTVLVWCAGLTAYALGQLCSMAIRSPVLAGFAAIALSAVLSLWTIVLGAWQLSALGFLAPLGVTALAASLLYSRAWLTERGGVRPWLAPASILAAAVGLGAASLPLIRLMQLDALPSAPLQATLARWNVDEPQARAVALQYERLAAVMSDLEREAGPEVGAGREIGGEQFKQFVAAGRDNGGEQLQEFVAANSARLDELAEITEAPRCRFTYSEKSDSGQGDAVFRLMNYLAVDAERLIDAGELDTALNRLIAWRRLCAHAIQYQQIFYYQYGPEWWVKRKFSDVLLRWATAPAQTSERVVRAVTQLREAEAIFPEANEPIMADHLEIQAIVAGKESPTFFRIERQGSSGPSIDERMAFFVNELPWERQRALLALDRMTEWKLKYVDAAGSGQTLARGNYNTSAGDVIKRLLDVGYAETTDGRANLPSPAVLGDFQYWPVVTAENHLLETSQTSYLPAIELGRRGFLPGTMQVYLDERARRAGDMIRLSLIAYRLDNGKYPETLGELVPKYSPQGLPLDPFTEDSLQYRPHGFDIPFAVPGPLDRSVLLPPGTPLLWSVGRAYDEPRERWIGVMEGPEGDATESVYYSERVSQLYRDEDDSEATHVMMLVPTTRNWREGSSILLRLPEIEPAVDGARDQAAD